MTLWMGIIFSPFVAFTVNGRVDDSNWRPAIITALACLAGLVFIHIRTSRRYAQLPADIQSEYLYGRVMPPFQGGAGETSPLRFGPRGPEKSLADLTPKGIWCAPVAICGASWGQRRKMADIDIKAGLAGGSELPTHAFDWSELVEWQVRDDTDGPAYYRIVLQDGAYVDLKRPRNSTEESPILDYVRSVGRRPVRLLCDVA